MITSASAAASDRPATFNPASVAFLVDDDPSRRPTRTSMPESRRFRAWAWPCEP